MDWKRFVFLAMEWLWLLAGVGSLAAAGLLAVRKEGLEKTESLFAGGGGRPPVLFALLVPALIVPFKLAQYQAFQTMYDTGIFSNIAWNFLHGHGAQTSAFGEHSVLTLHFSFVSVFLSPLLLLWESSAVMCAAQALAVASAPSAVYLLGRTLGIRPLFCGLLALMSTAHPFFHDLAGSIVDDSVFAFPGFVWFAYFWESGRRRTALGAALLLLPTREQIPFMFLGLGVYFLLRAQGRRERGLAVGLMAASVAVFAGEMAVIRSVASQWESNWDHWGVFSAIGGTPAGIFKTALLQPWKIAAALVYPPEKSWVIFRTLITCAGLPLASGPAFAAPLVVWLPQMLANAGGPYGQLGGHSSAYVFGPLLWACAHGLKRLSASAPAARRKTVAVWMMTVTGTCFLLSADWHLPEHVLPASWKDAVPAASAHIPANAKVWTDEYLFPHMAMRRYAKTLPFVDDGLFRAKLFRPDRVLLSAHWLRKARPEARDPILRYLESSRYGPIFRQGDLMVLADSGANERLGRPVEYIKLE